jgi:hypothetical protein
MTGPLSITKDVTFWYVVENALSLACYHVSEDNVDVVKKCRQEISAAIDAHLEETK